MPVVPEVQLKEAIRDIFSRIGASSEEISRLQEHLIENNLLGHDSHGVRFISEYYDMIHKGHIVLGADLRVLTESGTHAVLDGNWGLGQVMAMRAAKLAVEKVGNAPVAVVTLKNVSHIGRLGEYAHYIASHGFVGYVAVNGHGGAQNVAPWGGVDRRLSVNPLAYGIPSRRGPYVVDMSPTVTAAGKVAVKKLRGEKLPEGWVIDHEGNPTVEPDDYFGPPEGSLMPLGGHKGFSLGFVVDILAGALTGAGCSRPHTDRWGNGTLILAINPAFFQGSDWFDQEVERFAEYLKSSRPAPGVDEILLPGEPEQRERAKRKASGIFIEDATYSKLLETVRKAGGSAEGYEPV